MSFESKIVLTFYLLCLSERVKGIVVVELADEGLGKSDMHVDLEQIGLGKLLC